MTDRPHPLRDVATSTSATPSLAGGGASAAILAGILLRGELDLLAGVLAGLAVLLQIVVPLFTARQVARVGEQYVTPNTDPVDTTGAPLIAQAGAQLGQVLTEVLEQLGQLNTAARARPTAGTPVTSTATMPAVSERPASRDPASTRLPPPEPPGRHHIRRS